MPNNTDCTLAVSAAEHNRRRQAQLDAEWDAKWPNGALVVAYGSTYGNDYPSRSMYVGYQCDRRQRRFLKGAPAMPFYQTVLRIGNNDRSRSQPVYGPCFVRQRKYFETWAAFKAEAIKRGATVEALNYVREYLTQHNLNHFDHA